MGETNYWTKFAATRVSRRRALLGGMTLGTGLASAALIGCGGSSESTPTPTQATSPTASSTTSSATSTATATPMSANDPFAGAKQGGTLAFSTTTSPPSLDFYKNASTYTKEFSAFIYSRLFKYMGGPGIKSTEAPVTGDLADTAEPSGDGTEWVITLKPNAKFHNVAPVSGRQVTTEDVKFSWDRATAPEGVNRDQFEFITKAEFPDDRTMKFTLDAPNAAFLDVFANLTLFWVQPHEADGGFDPQLTAIGSGPFVFDNFRPDVGYVVKRNPDWYESGRPLLDEVHVLTIPEHATALAQFQAGNIDTFGPSSDEILSLKSQMPDAQIRSDLSIGMSMLYFDKDPNALWRDDRVRRAMSMGLDRDALLDLTYNISKLKEGGLDAVGYWNNVIPAGLSEFWVDPQGPDAGPDAAAFQYSPDEAMKLLSAAGHGDGFDITYQYTEAYGSTYKKVALATAAYLNELKINTNIEVQDYASVYYSHTWHSDFKGVAFGPESSFNEPGAYALRDFTPNELNHGWPDDETLQPLAEAQQREMDPAKRKEMFKQLQQYAAGKMYLIPNVIGGGTGYSMAKPTLKNFLDFAGRISYGLGAEAVPYYWFSA